MFQGDRYCVDLLQSEVWEGGESGCFVCGESDSGRCGGVLVEVGGEEVQLLKYQLKRRYARYLLLIYSIQPIITYIGHIDKAIKDID